MEKTTMKETTKYWITTKVINKKVVTLVNTRLSDGSIYFRPIRDDDGNPLTLGEFFGQAGTIDRMFAKSSDASQDVKLQADNQELIELARDNAIPVPDNTNI